MSNSNVHNNQLHITIGAATDRTAPVARDVDLLKAAMLYGDHVKLCSLTAALVDAWVVKPANLSYAQILELAEAAADRPETTVVIRDLTENYMALRNKRRRTTEELLQIKRYERTIRELQTALVASVEQEVSPEITRGIVTAVKSGLVDVQPLRQTGHGLANDFFEVIKEAVLGGETYPLFDEVTGGLLDSAVRAGELAPLSSAIIRGKQVGLSAGLFSRLPSFQDATVDEILDIRKELSSPLIRYRSAIIKFSREIESAAWTPSFPDETEQVFREHVEPAVLEIHEQIRANSPVAKLASTFFEKPLIAPAGSGIGLILAQATALPYLIALLGGAAFVGLEAYRQWREQQAAIQRNQLYFFYAASQRLNH
jgi:hypothetical protein